MRVSLPFACFLGAIMGFPFATQFVPRELHPTITTMFIESFLFVAGVVFALTAWKRMGTFLSKFCALSSAIAIPLALWLPSPMGEVTGAAWLVTYMFALVGGVSLPFVIIAMYDAVFPKNS